MAIAIPELGYSGGFASSANPPNITTPTRRRRRRPIDTPIDYIEPPNQFDNNLDDQVSGALGSLTSGGFSLGFSFAGNYTLTVPGTGTLVLGSGSTNAIPYWVSASTLGASNLVMSGSNVLTLAASAISTLTVPQTGTAALVGINNAFTTAQRTATSLYRRYYHLALGSSNPGASGATWVTAGANTTGGWRITNAAHLLRAQTDVHSDWDGATDLTFSVKFMVNVDNTGGLVTDTVDLKATIYYKGTGDTACKSQTVEVATVVGQSAQYKQFSATFTIDWDAASNVVEVGDVMAIILNLETDTSSVDDIVVTAMEYYYQTNHMGIEAGDV